MKKHTISFNIFKLALKSFECYWKHKFFINRKSISKGENQNGTDCIVSTFTVIIISHKIGIKALNGLFLVFIYNRFSSVI